MHDHANPRQEQPVPRRYTVLATACITPDPAACVARRNPQLRLADYVHALSWWLNLDDPSLGDVVVLENSGFDAAEFKQRILDHGATSPARKLEIIAYRAPAMPPTVHYGYSEFRMIDELMDRSSLLGAQFIKVTGRYTFPNITRLLTKTRPDTLFSIDSNRRPKIPPLFKTPSFGCHAWLFICNRAFYDKEIRKLYMDVEDRPRKTHVEGIIYDKFVHRHGTDGISLRFPVQCAPHGVGGNGQNLSTHKKRMEGYIRALQRRIMPWFWI